MTRTIHCRFCNGPRPATERGTCLGCGSSVAESIQRPRRWRKHCPKCTDGVLEMSRIDSVYRCETCGHWER